MDNTGSATRDGRPAPTIPPERPLGRARSQRLLVTLLGDYWRDRDDPLPSAALVRLLEEFGITAANARAALSRLTQRGMLTRSKQGRRTSYALTKHAHELLDRGAERIFGLGADPDGWDGTWTVVAFSIPLDASDLRYLLRSRLRWLTLSPLYDAVWVSPHDRRDLVIDQLTALGVTDATVIRAKDLSLLPGGRERLESAWDLSRLTERYEAYIGDYQDLAKRAAHGQVTPADALIQRTELMDDWRAFARDDPDLPRQFVPDDFPRAKAREVFLEAYEALSAPARLRFDQLVGSHLG